MRIRTLLSKIPLNFCVALGVYPELCARSISYLHTKHFRIMKSIPPFSKTDLRLCIAISVGCPCGIGPEVTVRALSEVAPRHRDVRFVVFGDEACILEATPDARSVVKKLANVSLVSVSTLSPAERIAGSPGNGAGRSQLAAVDAAADLVLTKKAQAMVTAPVSKRVITESGVHFLGHTEHLAMRAGISRVVMLFAGPRLRVSLVTTHVPICRVSECLTLEKVRECLVITGRAMRTDFAIQHPRIAIAGLNPHAGEGGLLGREEIDIIAPAIDEARALLPDCILTGPVPAEAVFRHAKEGRYDAVVAMYHDQATIASKLLDFGDAVNVTLALPFVRTSVDHGTAYDIAGKGIADYRGMVSALEMSVVLASSRALHA
jgi:4-hydroxythreonine-4-phosphate dehydrogenase